MSDLVAEFLTNYLYSDDLTSVLYEFYLLLATLFQFKSGIFNLSFERYEFFIGLYLTFESVLGKFDDF